MSPLSAVPENLAISINLPLFILLSLSKARSRSMDHGCSVDLPLPQLLDLPLPLVLDAAALADVLLFLFLPLGRLLDRLQPVLVEDLQLGELGFGFPPRVGDLLPQLVAEALLPRPFDALLLEPIQGQLVRRLHSRSFVFVRHGNRIASGAASASKWHAGRAAGAGTPRISRICRGLRPGAPPFCMAAPILLKPAGRQTVHPSFWEVP